MANESESRCSWLTNDPLYIEYHDNEWGRPEKNSQRLFEMICLEGQQAGLSWITILKKRENYRKHFHNFIPSKVAKMSTSDINNLLSLEAGVIIRHKGKLEALIHNAKMYLLMDNNGEDFSRFIWSFVDNKVIINSWNSQSEIPSSTQISSKLSAELKKRGFKFVGPSICYAFMQACGLVNDHLLYCRSRIT